MHRTSRIGEFAFELRENGEVIGAATNDAESKIAFERSRVRRSGRAQYEIVEVKGVPKHHHLRRAVFAVSVNVTDKDDSGAATGKLSAADWSLR